VIGSTLAHYQILELLGAGGMGAVYKAHDTRLGRDVALKVLPPDLLDDQVSRARLVREARTASQLSHPHICVIHEVGEADGVLYVAMELIPGSALQAMIPPRGLPTEAVLRYGVQIADALDHAHEHGVVHRDLKAANIVVTRGDQAKVLDFGIARRMEGFADGSGSPAVTLTGTGMIVGTPQAMAPEMLRGEKGDARSDLWSLGVVLYEMSCGRPPFAGTTLVDLCAAIVTGPLAPLPRAVPQGLRDVIHRCLEKDPAQRPGSAADVRAALEALRASGAQAPVRARGRRGRRGLLSVADVVLLAIATFVVLRSAALGNQSPQPPAVPAVAHRGLAVLPLENLSADPAQTFFADGMTEELIGNLGQIGDLRVISRNSVMRYRNTRLPLKDIARELGVDLLVTGSVRPGQDSVRIRAHLIQVTPERELWSAGYTREAGQVLAMQSEVAQEIAERISVQVTPGEQARMARAGTVQPAAYEEYLRGRSAWNQRTPEGMRQAIDHYERAIALDPKLAVAHAGLADAYGRLNLYTGRPPRETFPAAREAAETALRLDPDLAEAHASLAAVSLFYDRDWPKAKAEFQRAIELRPSYATAHHWYSIYLRDRGEFPAALAEAQQALDLDPLSPILRVNLADTHYYARQFDQAIRLHRVVLASDSTFAPAWLYLGMAQDQAGQPGSAVASVQRARALSGRGAYGLGALGYVQARAGNAEAARRADQELLELSAQGLAVAFDRALVHVGLGETGEALRWLERADEERASLNDLAVDPRFDPLRREERFRLLLDRLGLPRSIGGPAGRMAQNRR
jgi:serine/threonine-protein kinase